MASVTERISQIRQPYGGYVPPHRSSVTKMKDNRKLNYFENIDHKIMESAVDCLIRYGTGCSAQEAFTAPLNGAALVRDSANARDLLHSIRGLNDKAIKAACKLAGYDIVCQAGTAHYHPVCKINPNEKTIRNIARMVNRGLAFWDEYGPIVKTGFSFEGGYSFVVTAGNGGYLTADTLWIISTAKKKPTQIHTLKLLMHYIMGQHSSDPALHNVTWLGIFNPRLNAVYLMNISDINESVIEAVENDVICYGQH